MSIAELLPEGTQILHEETKEFVNGKEIKWLAIKAPLACFDLDPNNTRFGKDEPMDEETQHKEFIMEAPKETNNLAKSLTILPFSEFVQAYFCSNSKRFKIIHGNRRACLARKNGLEDILALIPINADQETILAIRDYPENHPTKVKHSPFAKAKNIHSYLSKCKNDSERKDMVEVLSKRRKLKKGEVEQQNRTIEKAIVKCEEIGVDLDDRKSQYKTFETYEKLSEKEIKEARLIGDFQRVEFLENICSAYIKNNIAHDDMAIVVSTLAKLPTDHSFIKEINEGEYDLSKIEDIRSLTSEIRIYNERERVNPPEEFKKAASKVFKLLQSDPNDKVVSAVAKQAKEFAKQCEHLAQLCS